MAKIVLGMATSHGPMLATPWRQWGLRKQADEKSTRLFYKGAYHTYQDLVSLRSGENLDREIVPERWESRAAACDAALDVLAARLADVAPDVVVLIGNDQMELFDEDKMPAMTVYWGEAIENAQNSPEKLEKSGPGIAVAEAGYRPETPAVYRGHVDLGKHLVEHLIEEEFDIAQSRILPRSKDGVRRIPHAYAFVYRRLMHDDPVPSVPVILNTFYPPNQPSAKRCYALGGAIKRGLDSWNSDARVAVIASGGLSHFVIDEELDKAILSAFAKHDARFLASIGQSDLQSGHSEIKNWIVLAGLMDACGMDMTLVDYQPCYRSEAGTGNAMGFAWWQ